MKTRTKRLFLAASLTLIAVVAIFVSLDRRNIATHSRVTIETGLILPQATRIVAISTNRFSLADGDNYEWLIQSDEPLTQWLESSDMTREDLDGISWANVSNFGEVASISRDEDRQLALDSVWKSVVGKKTAYLYLASGRRVALVTTFRP
jgi:hypothetical protein